MASREPFTTVRSAVIPLPLDNVDTDQIIPARFLKTTDRDGMAEGLFHAWRYLEDGVRRDPPFVLDRPEMQGRRVLLAGDNFGSGSSREHAPWALTAWGIRVVISTRFADIFRGNALRNGLLPVVVSRSEHERVSALVTAEPDVEIEVDLDAQVVRPPDGSEIGFEVDPFAKQMLLAGTDEIGWLVARIPHIETWEASRPGRVDTRTPNAAAGGGT